MKCSRGVVGRARWSVPVLFAGEGLSGLLALVVEGFRKPLGAQVAVPDFGEADVLAVESAVVGVVGAGDEPAPLLTADVVVAVVEGIEVGNASGEAQFEAHLRVAHQVAVLFAVMCDGEGGKTTRSGLVHCLDDQWHERCVVNGEGKAGVPTPGASEDVEDGLHYATSAIASVISSAAVGLVSMAERMRAEVFWMTSSDSVSRAALPW